MYTEQWMIVSANENATYDFNKKQVVKNPMVVVNRMVPMPGQPTFLPGEQIRFPVPEEELQNWVAGQMADVQVTPGKK